MDHNQQTEVTIEFDTESFAKMLAKTAAKSTATTTGVFVGMALAGVIIDRTRSFFKKTEVATESTEPTES